MKSLKLYRNWFSMQTAHRIGKFEEKKKPNRARFKHTEMAWPLSTLRQKSEENRTHQNKPFLDVCGDSLFVMGFWRGWRHIDNRLKCNFRFSHEFTTSKSIIFIDIAYADMISLIPSPILNGLRNDLWFLSNNKNKKLCVFNGRIMNCDFVCSIISSVRAVAVCVCVWHGNK